jgi:hypothetical protein
MSAADQNKMGLNKERKTHTQTHDKCSRLFSRLAFLLCTAAAGYLTRRQMFVDTTISSFFHYCYCWPEGAELRK